MSTDYIDVSEISTKGSGAYIHEIAVSMHPVLVFMPNLDYSGMHDAEDFAATINAGFMVLPITLSMLDLFKQMEFAGVHISKKLSCGLESALRSAIIQQLNNIED